MVKENGTFLNGQTSGSRKESFDEACALGVELDIHHSPPTVMRCLEASVSSQMLVSRLAAFLCSRFLPGRLLAGCAARAGLFRARSFASGTTTRSALGRLL